MSPDKRKSVKLDYKTTDLQKLAQKENFALFILTGMQSSLNHLRNVVPTSYISILIQSIEHTRAHIKSVQATRRTQRAIERHYKK